MNNSAYVWWKGCDFTQISRIGSGLVKGAMSTLGGDGKIDVEFVISNIGRIRFNEPHIGLYISDIGESDIFHMKYSNTVYVGEIG